MGLGEAGARESPAVSAGRLARCCLILASAAAPPGEASAATRHVWRNATTGEQIVVSGNMVTIGGRRYILRDCSTDVVRCVESDGPFNLVVSRRCGSDAAPVRVDDHVTRIWSMLHHTPILRDSRSPEILFEYSYEQGVTGIYYSGRDLNLYDGSGSGQPGLYAHRFLLRGGGRFLACR